MRAIIIDSYHYCSEKYKDSIYYSREVDEDAKKKVLEFYKKLKDIYKKLYEIDEEQIGVDYLFRFVDYLEGTGYVSYVNADRDIVDVYYLGQTLEEALETSMIDSLFSHSYDYELDNRKRNELDYSERFPGEEYFTCLYFAEYQVEMLTKYFGGNLPDKYKAYYEEYINRVKDFGSELEIGLDGKFKVKTLEKRK